MTGNDKPCPQPCPTYVPRPCKSEGFNALASLEEREGFNVLSGLEQREGFNVLADLERRETLDIRDSESFKNDLDELAIVPRNGGKAPKNKYNKNATSGFWRAAGSQMQDEVDGFRETYYFGDREFVTRDAYKRARQEPKLTREKQVNTRKSYFEPVKYMHLTGGM